jgi:hypothetical protein
MRGYNWQWGKSNNAVRAEGEGKYPATRLAALLSQRFPRYRGCSAADISETLRPCEWHHTSKFFKPTDYYSLESLASLRDRVRLRWAIAARKAKKSATHTLTGCVVCYLEWCGTRGSPRAIEHRVEDATVIWRGGKIVTILGPGLPPQGIRKMLGGRGFVIEWHGHTPDSPSGMERCVEVREPAGATVEVA